MKNCGPTWKFFSVSSRTKFEKAEETILRPCDIVQTTLPSFISLWSYSWSSKITKRVLDDSPPPIFRPLRGGIIIHDKMGPKIEIKCEQNWILKCGIWLVRTKYGHIYLYICIHVYAYLPAWIYVCNHEYMYIAS